MYDEYMQNFLGKPVVLQLAIPDEDDVSIQVRGTLKFINERIVVLTSDVAETLIFPTSALIVLISEPKSSKGDTKGLYR